MASIINNHNLPHTIKMNMLEQLHIERSYLHIESMLNYNAYIITSISVCLSKSIVANVSHIYEANQLIHKILYVWYHIIQLKHVYIIYDLIGFIYMSDNRMTLTARRLIMARCKAIIIPFNLYSITPSLMNISYVHSKLQRPGLGNQLYFYISLCHLTWQ